MRCACGCAPCRSGILAKKRLRRYISASCSEITNAEEKYKSLSTSKALRQSLPMPLINIDISFSKAQNRGICFKTASSINGVLLWFPCKTQASKAMISGGPIYRTSHLSHRNLRPRRAQLSEDCHFPLGKKSGNSESWPSSGPKRFSYRRLKSSISSANFNIVRTS